MYERQRPVERFKGLVKWKHILPYPVFRARVSGEPQREWWLMWGDYYLNKVHGVKIDESEKVYV